MKFRTLLIAASLAAGATAFAAPNDTAKAPAEPAAQSTTTGAKLPDVIRHPIRHARAAMHRHQRHQAASTTPAPQTSAADQGREARMDQALANYRKTHS
ncbi:MAG: hypothetical protein HYX47_21015 [Burkholderiales bacterium]|nr:hypothetical protein [Burkholderiales bacterium]